MAARIPNSVSLTFRPDVFEARLPVSTAWLLADCQEFRGKQDLWIRQKPEVLAALREQAIVQSAESSNRIEGVVVEPDRLRPLLVGKARPRDRSEEEVFGYRRALHWIFSRRHPVTVDTRLVLHLHRLAQGGTSGDAGRLKSKDNQIIELRPGEGRRVRFRPTSARETPAALRLLCGRYQEMMENMSVPSLLLVATFVFDFLCIHPFRDGNGRVSRLLTTLLLQQHNFTIGKFVSLERHIEQMRVEYYDALGACSNHWHEGRNEILPWWNYFLGIVRRAYVDFAEKVEHTASRETKSDLARRTILEQVGPFTLADVRAQRPAASPQLLKKILARLKAGGRIRLTGRGRGARWEVIAND